MIQEIEISKLHEADYNPRAKLKPGSFEWEQIRNSIVQFGNAEPLVWNRRTGNVAGGHQRLAVLKSLGYTAVPCSVVDLSLEDEKVLSVALNKIKGRWDQDRLEELLRSIDAELAVMTGFTAEDLALMFQDDGDIDPWDPEDDEWAGGEEPEDSAVNWVVSLVFPSWEDAAAYTAANFPGETMPAGGRAHVIRVEV